MLHSTIEVSIIIPCLNEQKTIASCIAKTGISKGRLNWGVCSCWITACFMISKTKKHDIVGDISDRLKKQKITIFSDFHGVSVTKSQQLRRLLKKNDAEYKVARKTLIDRALVDVGVPIKAKELKGEIGIAFGYGDEIAPAKIILKFSKENETFKLLGGLLGGRFLNDKEVLAMARLPSREVLLAKLLGVLQMPQRGLVNVLSANLRNLVVVLSKIRDKK